MYLLYEKQPLWESDHREPSHQDRSPWNNQTLITWHPTVITWLNVCLCLHLFPVWVSSCLNLSLSLLSCLFFVFNLIPFILFPVCFSVFLFFLCLYLCSLSLFLPLSCLYSISVCVSVSSSFPFLCVSCLYFLPLFLSSNHFLSVVSVCILSFYLFFFMYMFLSVFL